MEENDGRRQVGGQDASGFQARGARRRGADGQPNEGDPRGAFGPRVSHIGTGVDGSAVSAPSAQELRQEQGRAPEAERSGAGVTTDEQAATLLEATGFTAALEAITKQVDAKFSKDAEAAWEKFCSVHEARMMTPEYVFRAAFLSGCAAVVIRQSVQRAASLYNARKAAEAAEEAVEKELGEDG